MSLVGERSLQAFETVSAWPALVRIGIYLLIWGLLWLPLAMGIIWFRGWRWQLPMPPEQKIPLVLSLYGFVPLLLWGYIHAAESSWADYGLSGEGGFWRSSGLGFVAGALGVTLLVGLQQGMKGGWLLSPKAGWRSTLPLASALLGLTLVIGFIEELVFRGFVVNQLQPAYAPWATALISSLIFALLHLVWDGPAGLVQLPGLCLMGGVLWIARWTNGGQLGLAWGLHAGWIWSFALLDAAQLWSWADEPRRWLMGRPGEPLTGALSLGLLSATGLVLWVVGEVGGIGQMF